SQTSNPKIGVPSQPIPGINGLSWLAVEQTSNSPFFTQSQAQPEPNCVAAALEKASLNASNEPNFLSIAPANSPLGCPPPFGDITVQNKLWLKYPPPLLRTALLFKSRFSKISSIVLPSKFVPSIAAFRLFVYP